MIKPEEINEIISLVTEFWKNKLEYTTEFKQMLINKESGHSIADYVDAQTCERLKQKNKKIKYESNKRSMGDFWLSDENDIYTPVNIKSGTVSNGSPNIVSINKLIEKLSNNEIDSYYLLIIKFPNLNSVDVYFINLIDYLEFTNFDSGPGQLMLKEKKLYDFLKSGSRNDELDIKTALNLLIEKQEKALPILLQNRQNDINEHKKIINKYDPLKKINQKRIKLLDKPKY